MSRGFLFVALMIVVTMLAFAVNPMAGNHWGSSEYAATFAAIWLLGVLLSWGIADEFGHY